MKVITSVRRTVRVVNKVTSSGVSDAEDLHKTPSHAYAILFGAQLAVGAAAIFARYALTGAEPLAISALRLVIASAVFLGIALAGNRERRLLTRREHLLLLFAGIALAAHFAGWIWSLQFTSVAISTLLVCSSPIWIAAYDSLVLRRRLATLAWFGFACGAAGLAIVLHSNVTLVPLPGHPSAGYALALAGSLAIAAYLILVREVRAQLSTRAIVTRTYAYAAVALTLAALLTHQGPPALANKVAWFGIFAMALISQSLGHTAINVSLHFFSPSAIAFATLFEPVVAAILAAVIFHETLSALTLSGGFIVLLSIGAVLYAEAARFRN